MNLREYIEKSSRKSKIEFSINGVPIIIHEPTDFDLTHSVETVKRKIPFQFFRGLLMIHIGNYKELSNSNRVSLYDSNNQIYILNSLSATQFETALIHELAHHLEITFQEEIYGDGELKAEFLRKRQRLFGRIKEKYPKITSDLFTNLWYSAKLEKLLFLDIGEEVMINFVSGLFANVYSVVSLREYFANGFENIVADAKSADVIRVLNPTLYKIISNLFQENR